MTGCDARGPLIRSGSTQADRDLAELDPGHFRLDERELADLVLYAKALSREIRHWAPGNTPAGTWEPFFASDLTAVLAQLARLPTAPLRTALADVEEFLKAEAGRPVAQLRAHFNLIFHLPVALFGALAEGHARLPRDHPLHARLTRLVEDDLAGPLGAAVGWWKGATGTSGPLGDPPPDVAAGDFGTGAPGDARPRLSDTVAGLVAPAGALTDRAIAGPSAEALGAVDWAAFCVGITADDAPYLPATAPNLVYNQIYEALSYNLLSSELERAFQGLERARGLAAEALATSLEAVDDHAPHYGLFLAFLDMLAVARGRLNGMTARHLDFYHREVLRMAPRGPVPASAHVLLELAKGTEAHLKPAGTGLKAGKDATGAPVTFRLSDDIVANRARVTDLRAVRLHATRSGGEDFVTVHASPVANSADGQGAELPPDAPAWAPFGPPPWPEGATAPAVPFARLGFAVADRRLFLREGARTIALTVWLEAPFAANARPKLKLRLTGPDGWFEPAAAAGVISHGNIFAVAQTLQPDEPAVVPFDPALHLEDQGRGHAPGLPVCECLWAFEARDDRAARSFAVLRDARISSMSLQTSAAELRALTLHTPDGTADAAKPFAPFGVRPKPGAAFVVGSAEAFSKTLSSLTIKLAWQTPHSLTGFFARTPTADYKADVSWRAGGRWSDATSNLSLKLDAATPSLNLPEPSRIDGRAAMSLTDPAYAPTATTGFVRLALSQDFGHARHAGEVTRANIAMARGVALNRDTTAFNYGGSTADGWTPKAPYDLVATDISLAYVTEASAPEAFLHIAPFGQDPRAPAGDRLLPDLPFEGALYVGVADFRTPARLSLLAQVANGSGDPLLETPQLSFRYLAGDDWTPFKDAEVDDKTGNFAASAVLGLAAPAQADAAHAILPADLRWFRIAAPENAAAVNSLIALAPQAVRAVFDDAGNDPQYLAAPTPAGTLAKLSVPDPKVKKVVQPFASFGGRPEETARAFRRRAAERLRHKDRASTLWDYERIALDAAPELYRVKCLPHAELVREGGKVVADDELSPGGVVVVTVPWTRGRPHLDPLRPYADQATLKTVRDALAPRLSPFARLEVANPKFEEVLVSFKVAFRAGVDDAAFHLDEMRKAVVGHLAPWSRPDGGADIVFGGKLRKSAVVDFVDELPYVDFVEDFRLFHRPDPEVAAWTPVDKEIVEATTARSILVSAPAAAHDITELV